MNDQPLISVIVPTRNSERFLPEALASVAAQTWYPFEVVVVDGGSTDATAAIATSFPSVRLIHQRGMGLSDAWNCGIDAARGDWIAFLDSDDIYLPQKLAVQGAELASHPDAGYVDGEVEFALEPGTPLPAGFRPELLNGRHVGRMPGSIVVRRSLFDSVGRFATGLAVAGDIDWFARVKDAGVVSIVVKELVLRKRVHDGNLSLQHPFGRELLRLLRESVVRQRSTLS